MWKVNCLTICFNMNTRHIVLSILINQINSVQQDDNDDDDDLSDSEMMKFDNVLAAVFRERSAGSKEKDKKERRTQMIEFKQR